MTAVPIRADDDLNDIGNGERLATSYWGTLAYVPELGTWRRWTGIRWQDDNDEAMRCAQSVARSWFDDLTREADPKRQHRVLLHAQRSSSIASIRAMLDIAKTQGLTVPQREWDADPQLLGVENGVIDLRSGLHFAGNPTHRISKAAAASYRADATAPTWSAFLDRIMDGDLPMIAFLQRAIGYSLTGSTAEQCLFICHGRGANGKSVFLHALDGLLGDYARTCSTETLLARRDGAIPNDLARLAGARLVTALETEDGKRIAEALVKGLTGGDKILARFLHREFFEFVPTFKVWLATNHKPTIRGDDHAIWRRIRLIPFAVTIPDAEQDHDLIEKLQAERAGILRWAIDGCIAWQRDGLRAPAAVQTATEDYRADMDRIGQWITEQCVFLPSARVQAAFAYRDYRQWAEARGEQPLSLTAFGNRLTERGVQKIRGKTVIYTGIGLCDTSPTLAPHFEVNPIYTHPRNKKQETARQVSQNGQVSQIGSEHDGANDRGDDADAYRQLI